MILRLVLGDQLNSKISSLRDVNKEDDLVLMCEVVHEATHVKHHKKKLVFIFSAMRHFAAELERKGCRVIYSQLDDSDNSGSFFGEVRRIVRTNKVTHIIVTEPSEYYVSHDMQSWSKRLGVEFEMRGDDRFLCDKAAFAKWAGRGKVRRMEYFYRTMRQQHAVLMDGAKPVGGQWNFDSDNRHPPDAACQPPEPIAFKADAITKAVKALVAERFDDHFGEIEPCTVAVTRKQALRHFNDFIDRRLASFGRYQDAMMQGQPTMYHALIGAYLNCGLLLPMECIRAAEHAYYQGEAPLSSVEAFIRQVLGWREYIRGMYWLHMPDYEQRNALSATRDLPEFYWHGSTEMNCLKQCVQETQQHAYAHHIQRLMVLGNFLLLIGVEPKQANEWYWIVYMDAYQWVELPNVSGMTLFADGGDIASKPYAASGAYINKMSNYCKSCCYKVKQKIGPDACPFNYLYWDFIDRNRNLLAENPRMAMMLRVLDKMSGAQQQAIRDSAQVFLAALK